MIYIAGLVVGLLIVVSCTGLNYQAEIPVPESHQISEYSFAPATVQAAISAGHPDALQLVWERGPLDTREPDVFVQPTRAPDYPPVSWSEADYERIVLAGLSGKVPTRDLRLSYIWFRLPCRHVSFGPQLMRFTYLTLLESKDPGKVGYNLYAESWATVDSEIGRLTWDEQEKFRAMPVVQKTIDRTGKYIPAEVALQMAEQSGGADFRTALGNACEIHGFLVAGVANSDWQVVYAPGGLPSGALEVQIDRETGRGKIIKTPQP